MADESKTIIDSKYRDKYKTPIDWLAEFVDSQVKKPVMKTKTVTDEESGEKTETQVETKKTRVDMDALFGLMDQNNIDVAKYEEQRDRPNAAGRLRMTFGNMLRAAAKKRHGLVDLNGEWHDAPAEFVGDHAKTHNRDGSKIEAPKAETADEGEGEEA